MDRSPFNRSGLTRRSPPPQTMAAPESQPASPGTKHPEQEDDPPEVASTSEISNWMASIEQFLGEISTIATEGKLNSDQKLRINNICRKVSHGTSQMAVYYQSLKQKSIQSYFTIQALKEKLDLSRQLQELKQSIEQSSKPESGTVSFAEMVKKGASSFIQPSNISSLAIYPTDKLKSSEETKALVQKIIKPEEMKLHVRGLRKVKNGGVIISTDSKEDIEKLKKSELLTTSCLTMDDTHKRNPRIVVIGVPASMQETEVFNCIFRQNLADRIQDMTIDNFLASVKLSHKSGKKDASTCNYIIEVPALVRRALMANDRVFVNWSSCPVRDFTLVTRCYKCQQYGHAAKFCRDESNTCGHCGDVGHAMKECTKKLEPPKCATCLHYKKPCNHKTGDPDCPAKISAEKGAVTPGVPPATIDLSHDTHELSNLV